MIRTVICDDHPLITQGLTSYIAANREIEIVGSAASVTELWQVLSETNVDVLLLDIQLPDGNGVDLCPQIKQKYPHIQVLGLSNIDERPIILQMIQGGASGYVLKSAPMDEISTAIVHVHAGGVYLGADVQKSLVVSSTEPTDKIPPVTRREKEVLRYLAKGLSSPQIAEKMYLSVLTIDTHRRNLLRKFQVNKTVNLLDKAKKAGLLDS